MANKKQSWVTSISIIVVVILVGWLASGLTHTGTEETHAPSTEESTRDQANAVHAHEPINLTDPEYAPAVSIAVTQDPDAGWNLHATTTNFTYTPELVGLDPIQNEGHADLYINDKKITRLYGDWYYLGELEPGEHHIRVELNANNHSPFTVNEVAVEDTLIVHVEDKENVHMHEEMTTQEHTEHHNE